MGALYNPQKVKDHPSELTLQKTTQKFWKYNSDNKYVLETKLTKEKFMLLGLVRPP